MYLSMETAARVHTDKFIVRNFHRNCNLQATMSNGQLRCSEWYASIQTVLNMRPRSASASDPTNSWVPTCAAFRRHSNTTNTVRLPTDPTTNRTHCTLMVKYVDHSRFDDDRPDHDFDVVPLKFQAAVSSGRLSFVKFILAENAGRLSRQ